MRVLNIIPGQRPDGWGSIGVAVEQAGGRKVDFRQPQTRKIKGWGLKKTLDQARAKRFGHRGIMEGRE